jgi:hypothetical protein
VFHQKEHHQMEKNANQTDDLTTGADTGFTTDFGVAQPGSPADAMGTTVPAPSGDVGAADPGAGSSLDGNDQSQDRGLVTEGSMSMGDAHRPRLVDDVNPDRSNISGPTPLEEGRGG